MVKRAHVAHVAHTASDAAPNADGEARRALDRYPWPVHAAAMRDTSLRGACAAVALVVLASVVMALSPSPAAAAEPPTVVSYKSAYGPYQVQTLGVQADAPTVGGNGTYTLQIGTTAIGPLPFDAMASDVRDAFVAAGFDITRIDGGPDGLTPFIGSTRYTMYFATDPGAIMTVIDNQTVRHISGFAFPGAVEGDCVFCMDVYAPTGTPNGAAMIFLHAGGLISGSRDLGVTDLYRQRFSAMGYVTVSMNYRLTFYGRGLALCDFDTSAPTGACAALIQAGDDAGADAQVATKYLTDHAAEYGLVPDRIALAGGSGGGVATFTAAYRTPDADGRRPDAVVTAASVVRDQLQGADASPVMVFAFTHDPAYQRLGMDSYEEGREALSKARALGNPLFLHGYAGYGHFPDLEVGTAPGSRDQRVEAEDVVATIQQFFAVTLFHQGAFTSHQWFGAGSPWQFTRPLGGQTMFTRPTETRRPLFGDYNGDGLDDLLWYGSGAAADNLWLARADGTYLDPIDPNPPTIALFAPYVDQPGTYSSPVVGDFDRNGRDDVLWWGGGTPQLWRFGLGVDNRPTIMAVPAAAPPLAVPLVGDFDGDLIDDIFWNGPGLTPDSIWYGSTLGTFTGTEPLNAPSGSYVPLVGDFDGDRRSDIFWHGAGALAESIWFGAPRATRVDRVSDVLINTDADKVFKGDFDGDGRADVFVYGYGLKADAVWYSSATRAAPTKVAKVVFGTFSPAVGNFDGTPATGTPTDDIAWVSAGASTLALWSGTNDRRTVASSITGITGMTGTANVAKFDGFAGGASVARADIFWS